MSRWSWSRSWQSRRSEKKIALCLFSYPSSTQETRTTSGVHYARTLRRKYHPKKRTILFWNGALENRISYRQTVLLCIFQMIFWHPSSTYNGICVLDVQHWSIQYRRTHNVHRTTLE